MQNVVALVGTIVHSGTLNKTAEGSFVKNVTIDVRRPFKNLKGHYDSDYIECVLWNKLAENAEKYCRDGCIAILDGRIQTRKYIDNDGNKRKCHEIVVEKIRFLSNVQ